MANPNINSELTHLSASDYGSDRMDTLQADQQLYPQSQYYSDIRPMTVTTQPAPYASPTYNSNTADQQPQCPQYYCPPLVEVPAVMLIPYHHGSPQKLRASQANYSGIANHHSSPQQLRASQANYSGISNSNINHLGASYYYGSGGMNMPQVNQQSYPQYNPSQYYSPMTATTQSAPYARPTYNSNTADQQPQCPQYYIGVPWYKVSSPQKLQASQANHSGISIMANSNINHLSASDCGPDRMDMLQADQQLPVYPQSDPSQYYSDIQQPMIATTQPPYASLTYNSNTADQQPQCPQYYIGVPWYKVSSSQKLRASQANNSGISIMANSNINHLSASDYGPDRMDMLQADQQLPVYPQSDPSQYYSDTQPMITTTQPPYASLTYNSADQQPQFPYSFH